MRSRSAMLAVLAARTLGSGTRGLFGDTRSIQTQTKLFSLPLLRTANAKRPGICSVADNDRAIRRTSAWVAINGLQIRAHLTAWTVEASTIRLFEAHGVP